MKTAFVTGSTGLLGNNLVRALLQQGWAVRALVRDLQKARRNLPAHAQLRLVQGDMSDVVGFVGGAALDDVDVVFHCAAYFREYYARGDHAAKLELINVTGTALLAEAAAAHGVGRFVDVSSAGVIGLKPDGSPGDESTPPSPLADDNLYFRSKVRARARLDAVAARTGLEVLQVLPGWMFGPGDEAPTSAGQMVIDLLAQKIPAVPPGGTCVVDARDVAAGMIRVAEDGVAGERYLLSGRYASLRELATTTAAVSGVRAPSVQLPYAVAWSFAVFSELVAWLKNEEALVNRKGVTMLQARLASTSQKAMTTLGVRFRPLDQTLRDTAAWYVEQGRATAPARLLLRAAESP